MYKYAMHHKVNAVNKNHTSSDLDHNRPDLVSKEGKDDPETCLTLCIVSKFLDFCSTKIYSSDHS